MLSCRIALLRRRSGMNQSQLAEQLHISPSTVGMYEQNRRTPNIDILIKLSRTFNVSLDYLITGLEFSPAPEDVDKSSILPTCPCCGCCNHKFFDGFR